MLPLPNLDDRLFDQIVKDARKAIPKLLPQWTDENAHDPGITLIEMLAWYTEMQQYYLNRITDKNELKFLKLLGIKPRDAIQAKAEVSFGHAGKPQTLPKGTPLLALDLPFETVEPLQLIPAKLERVIVRTETAANDYTSFNENIGVAYYAFGPAAASGSRLYIAFDQALPEQELISLSLKLFDDYPVSVGSSAVGANSRDSLVSSAKVSWRYYGDGADEGWIPLDLLEDTTVHLLQSGRILFRIASPMKPLSIHPSNDKRRYWICCFLEAGEYEIAPKLEKISLNSVTAAQRRTYSEIAEFEVNGDSDQHLSVTTHLAFYGLNRVQGMDDRGIWHDNQHFTVEKDSVHKTTGILLSDEGLGPDLNQYSRIRLISSAADFYSRWLGRSNGLPNQSFDLNIPHCLLEGFKIQVGKRLSGTQEFSWQDWTRVDNFDRSGSSDRHYVLDTQNGKVTFGNNEEGIIPPKSDRDNICIVSCIAGGGVGGNVKAGLIQRIAVDDPELGPIKVINPFPAKGGRERESIEDTKSRMLKDLAAPYRGVTNEDYEYLARSTPGLRIARVKALPLFAPGLKGYPQNKAPAQMTVVVVPYSESNKPVAGPGFLETVKQHLDKIRLITTEVHVIPADYVKITVHAVVIVQPELKGEVHKIIDELYRLLQPLDRLDGVTGWTFGRTVYKGDIYGAINKISGIEYVQDLWIDAEGADIQKDNSGDIRIPPSGLVYSGEHQIELVSIKDV